MDSGAPVLREDIRVNFSLDIYRWSNSLSGSRFHVESAINQGLASMTRAVKNGPCGGFDQWIRKHEPPTQLDGVVDTGRVHEVGDRLEKDQSIHFDTDKCIDDSTLGYMRHLPLKRYHSQGDACLV